MKPNQSKSAVILLPFETYLVAIEHSLGSKLFRNLYAVAGGRKRDITEDGRFSCAVFVSSILLLFGWISCRHATVDSTVKDMKKRGWRNISKPKRGAVIVWGECDFGDGEIHKHIGFYVGKNKAISNNFKKKSPALHDWQSKKLGEVEAILWNDAFDKANS